MKKVFLLCCVGLLLATSAAAQTPTLASVHINIYKTSAPTVIVASADYPASALMCGQTPSPPATGTVFNPNVFEFGDPAFPPDGTKACRASILALMNTLPVLPATDTYFARGIATYSDGGTSVLSTPSNPFTQYLYQALLGLRFIK